MPGVVASSTRSEQWPASDGFTYLKETALMNNRSFLLVKWHFELF